MHDFMMRFLCLILFVAGSGMFGCSNQASQTVNDNAEKGTPSPNDKFPTEGKPETVQLLNEPIRHLLSGDAIQPHVTVDTKSNIYVAYLHKGNIVVSASTDRGASFAPPVVAIDNKGHARGGRQRGPRIGVGANQQLVVTAPLTFDPEQWKQKYPRAELYTVSATDGGKTWSVPIRINEKEKRAPEALHWLAVAPSGVAVVAWLDIRDRDRGQDIYFARIANGKVSPNTSIERTVCECCAPGLAVDDRGNPFLGFREGGKSGSREIFVSHSTDGGKSFSKRTQINQQRSQEYG